jgi:DNA-binding transcriptional LysR family regulator
LERRVRLALPHLMALPEILRSTDLVAAVPARAAAKFGAGVATFDLEFLALEPWTLHMLWSPYARKNQAQAWLRGAISAICAGLSPIRTRSGDQAVAGLSVRRYGIKFPAT